MTKHPDTKRLDWLTNQPCAALIPDDAGRWAVVGDGMQNIPDPDKATDISTTFFIAAHDWHNTARQAIDAAIRKERQESKQ